jgi:N-acetylglucosamine kinase-like BadF-type ATPase
MTDPRIRRGPSLGIDAGGTKTAWLALDGDAVLGEGEAESIQATVLGPGSAARRLAEVVRAASAAVGRSFAAAVAGMAGAGSAAVRAEIGHVLAGAGIEPNVVLAGDVLVAAAAALAAGPGVALWSGTGSFAVARAADQRLHRVGGRGWLLGDGGSAFDMARRAAAAAVAAADGLGEPTALARELTAALGVRGPLDLSWTLPQQPPRTIAGLYPLVRRAAEAGDGVALAIQRRGALSLARQAAAALARADLPLSGAMVVLGGGVLAHDDGMQRLVAGALRELGMARPPEVCSRSAARGAAELARAHAAGEMPFARWLADGAA